MRWQSLFADLEAQAEALERAELGGAIEERTRAEIADVTLAERLHAAIDQPLRLACLGGIVLAGVVIRAGPDWVLMHEDGAREVLVRAAAIASVHGLGRRRGTPAGSAAVAARLGVRHVLRSIARDRLPVRILLADGSGLDGIVDAVGADFLEVRTHPAGDPGRRADRRPIDVVPLGALVAVRRVL
jgi:hypothetical protein